MRKRIVIAAAFAGAAFAAAAGPAFAITCDGNFQVQRSGHRIVAPYCQDANLARVAREYGARVNPDLIRWNPSEKERLCRFMGDDNRVRDTCAPYRDDSRQRWR